MLEGGSRQDQSPAAPSPGQPALGAAIATARTPGFDVARALAILGMVLVNYRMKLEVGGRGPDWLVWLSDRLDGRASALFVVIAGVGVSLRSRRAREDPARYLSFERRALLKRAAVLFAAGLCNLHLWEWDILHCYGLFLATAALLLNVRGYVLLTLVAACLAWASLLQVVFDYDADFNFWTPRGALTSLLFNGVHPFFPWMAFLMLGMWVGRLDLNETRIRRRVLWIALVCATLGELVDSVAQRMFGAGRLSEYTMEWLSSWPGPPRPVYFLAAAATVLVVICLCIEWTRPRPLNFAVIALTATGQLAFTHYILHALVVVILMQHSVFEDASLYESIGYSFAFYLLAVALSVWWRRRYAYGPLEMVIRQITGRTSPAPWGGQLVSAVKD